MDLQMRWKLRPPGGVFQGRCCIDGSGLNLQDRILCRAGWSVCQIDNESCIVGEVCGNLPGPVQHS
eukprot:5678366-Karenia_brevis.AAC.1